MGLAEIGFLEGRDVTVGCHTAEGHHQGDAETARRLEITMANSKTIAGLIGPTLIALAAALLINLGSISALAESVSHDPGTSVKARGSSRRGRPSRYS